MNGSACYHVFSKKDRFPIIMPLFPVPGPFSFTPMLLNVHSVDQQLLILLIQVSELQKDRVAYAEVAIERMFHEPDKKMAELICEARQSYESKCSHFVLLFHT